ncbi:MAG: AAA family ATPase [Thermoflexibacter sp.]|nr:AAA family ATPase [Thermoflexibacter sp.]
MIVTFYSYKGGVGRTQLMANIAAYLCYQHNKKVLLIDWDLEAPGIHFYFKKSNQDITNKGIVEVFQDYCKLVRSAENLQDLKIEDFPKFTDENIIKLIDTSQLTQTTEKQEIRTGKIDLIPAGKYSEAEEYKRNVIDFDWYEFYETLDGKRYIEYIKKELKGLDYDYILIDSRTGLSDYSNICNIQLPEVNILVIAPTYQNLEGCLQVAKSIVNSPYVTSGKFRRGVVLPVLSRVEVESPEFEPFFNAYQEKYGFLIENLLNQFFDNQIIYDEILLRMEDSYFYDSLLGYNKFIAIGENILFSEKASLIRGLGENYVFIAEFIRVFNEKDLVEKSKKNHTPIASFSKGRRIKRETINELLDLVDERRIAEVFMLLLELGVRSSEFLLLRSEYISGRHDVLFYDRLKLYIKGLGVGLSYTKKRFKTQS